MYIVLARFFSGSSGWFDWFGMNAPVKRTFIHYCRDEVRRATESRMDDSRIHFEHGSYWSYPKEVICPHGCRAVLTAEKKNQSTSTDQIDDLVMQSKAVHKRVCDIRSRARDFSKLSIEYVLLYIDAGNVFPSLEGAQLRSAFLRMWTMITADEAYTTRKWSIEVNGKRLTVPRLQSERK